MPNVTQLSRRRHAWNDGARHLRSTRRARHLRSTRRASDRRLFSISLYQWLRVAGAIDKLVVAVPIAPGLRRLAPLPDLLEHLGAHAFGKRAQV
jgi:hypothetical protein